MEKKVKEKNKEFILFNSWIITIFYILGLLPGVVLTIAKDKYERTVEIDEKWLYILRLDCVHTIISSIFNNRNSLKKRNKILTYYRVIPCFFF